MKTRPCLSLKHVIVSTYKCILFVITSMTIVFSGHAATIENKPTQLNPTPSINLKQCRLANYVVEFDVMRGKSNVGKATRELKQADENSNFHLLSSLTASMAFLKFIQKEQSILEAYKEIGLYSSEYSKYTKKPFKRKVNHTYPVNALVSTNNIRLLDPLSVYDHLRELACSGLRTNITLKVQEENEATQYHFEFKGEQTLQLPMGAAQTILFVRTRKTSTRETSVWFNKNNHFLPVKIQQEKDGDTQAVLVAKSIDFELLD